MSEENVAALPPATPPEQAVQRYSSLLSRQDGHLEAAYRDYRIRSAFQPIFSFAHNRPVGFEGLARARNGAGETVAAGTLLSADNTPEGIIFLDRLLRTLHLANFSGPAFQEAWLFLNVSPRVVVDGRTYGSFFREVLRAYNVPPQRVVVEVTETETSDENALEDSTRYYRELGCLVAIDDFGAGHSNFNRIWRLRPDIIKLDRLMIAQAARDPAARRGLVGIAGLLHEIGALVLAEGIETEEEAVASLQAEVDLLQGYLLQRPFIGEAPSLESLERFNALRQALVRQTKNEEAEFGGAIRPYLETFERAAETLAGGTTLSNAVGELLMLNHVVRCYLLDESGSQKGDNLTSPYHATRRDLRHLPLISAKGANWMHRHYFRRALGNPQGTQISRPYLSLTDPQMCVTLSRLVERERDRVVLCCDLEYPVTPGPGTRSTAMPP